ncbi:MAG: V-type ATP synthase subunit A [Bacillota bacterium]|nr:V-type ATP synthase subunit A [Bacillota bacterium]
MTNGTIYEINGPVVKVRDVKGFSMMEMVRVGNAGLIGEVIGINGRDTIIQVYEPTSGICPGEPVVGNGTPLSVQLAPGIIGNIFDGIERPLVTIEGKCGAFMDRGVQIPLLDNEKLWDINVVAKEGDQVSGGYIIAQVQETPIIVHRAMIPPKISGKIVEVRPSGQYTITDWIVKVKQSDGNIKEICLLQEWPIRETRPYVEKKTIDKLLTTGQRVIDTLFPIAKGGTAAIPGGFGTGKTMTQHQLAKWADADIIVYIGCGERGNEMTQVLEEFSELVDPKTNRPLLDRTVLIANTSNMPVAAREASIYTGITLAEYYRDMGYHVAIMADSTSRWAEALREISGRLEEMPAEEGFPAYLPSRLAGFYERAGYVNNLNGTDGSVTIIGAVSPQGGDFSEPVTQNTKRFIRCFWALDRDLAYARHYPAINWLGSYSEYKDELESWFEENVNSKFAKNRARIVRILQEESSLMEIVKLIGSDVLPDGQRLDLEIARVIRVGYLQQNAFHAEDTYVPLEKQAKMMELILYLYDMAKGLVEKGIPLSIVAKTGIFNKVVSVKYDIPNDKLEEFVKYKKEIDTVEESIKAEYNN